MRKAAVLGAMMAATMSFAKSFNAAVTRVKLAKQTAANEAQPAERRSRFRCRIAGKARPAGSKLARMAKEGRLGLRHS